MMDLEQEARHLQMLQDGWRLVKNAKRKRKLKKRGEHLRWSVPLQGWLWRPGARK